MTSEQLPPRRFSEGDHVYYHPILHEDEGRLAGVVGQYFGWQHGFHLWRIELDEKHPTTGRMSVAAVGEGWLSPRYTSAPEATTSEEGGR